MPAILLHVVPATIYALLGLHFWRTRWISPTSQPVACMAMWERALLLGALAVQGVGLFREIFPAGGMRFGFSYAVALMIWLALLFYWIESFYSRLEGLHMLGLPLAAVGALLPLIFPALSAPQAQAAGLASSVGEDAEMTPPQVDRATAAAIRAATQPDLRDADLAALVRSPPAGPAGTHPGLPRSHAGGAPRLTEAPGFRPAGAARPAVPSGP